MLARLLLLNILVICSAGTLRGATRIVPTPQYYEPENKSVLMTHGGTLEILLGPLNAGRGQKLQLAANFLRRDLEQADSSLRISIETGNGKEKAGARIYLWDYSRDPKPGVELNFLDQNVLADPRHYGDGYVVRTSAQNSIWIIGGTDEGALLGAMSVLQLMESGGAAARRSRAPIFATIRIFVIGRQPTGCS